MQASESYDLYWASGLHRTTEWSEEQLVRWFSPVLGAGRLLDYGCGMGYSYQRLLAQRVGMYVGADISEVAMEDCRKKGLEWSKISNDGSLLLPDSSFDAAVCSEVFEHLDDPLSAAKEIFRLLKPGGVLVATVPNNGYFAWRLLALLRGRVWCEPEDYQRNPFKGVHIRFFTTSLFKRLFQLSGFKTTDVGCFVGCNIFDAFYACGPLARIGNTLSNKLPVFSQFGFLGKLYPALFASRIIAISVK
jgi:SAM-dependent methyltransferase